MRGLRRLFRLQLREPLRGLEKGLGALATVQMRATTVPPMKHLDPLAEQLVTAALDRLACADPLPQDRAQFVARRDEVRGRLGLVVQEIARLAAQIVDEAVAVAKKLNGLRTHAAACADIEQQMARLLGRRFVAETPAAQLAHLPRYLKAIAMRLDKLRADPARDAARLAEIQPLQAKWLREVAARKGVADPGLDEFRWLLEELRVSLFAQELRTPVPVSVKRLEKVWTAMES